MGMEEQKKEKRGVKVVGVITVLVLLSIYLVYSYPLNPPNWLSIQSIRVNNGLTNEVGVGQNLSVEVVVGSWSAPSDTNATVRVNVLNLTGSSVGNLSPSTPPDGATVIYRNTNTTFRFSNVTTIETGEYALEISVEYEKNTTTNDTVIDNSTRIKVIALLPAGLGIAHEDVAAGEVATFKQSINNYGNISATATVRAWIYYDDNLDGDYSDPEDDIEASVESSGTIKNNSIEVIETSWQVPSAYFGCSYANSSKYNIFSSWKYGSASWSSTGNILSNFNLSAVEVGEICVGGFCESGLYSGEIGPGGGVGGGLMLKNKDINKNVTIHEVAGWVEDSAGNKITDLSPSDNSLNIFGNSYINNIVPTSNAPMCNNITYGDPGYNATLDYAAAKTFAFLGTLPENVNTTQTYKVVFSADYGVQLA